MAARSRTCRPDRLDGCFLFFLLICGRKIVSNIESDQGLLNAAEIARNTDEIDGALARLGLRASLFGRPCWRVIGAGRLYGERSAVPPCIYQWGRTVRVLREGLAPLGGRDRTKETSAPSLNQVARSPLLSRPVPNIRAVPVARRRRPSGERAINGRSRAYERTALPVRRIRAGYAGRAGSGDLGIALS